MTDRITYEGLTTAQCSALGMGNWDGRLRLIPHRNYNTIAYGQTLTAIDGDTIVVKPGYDDAASDHYIDDDYRGGMLAFGVIPTDAPADAEAE